MEYRYGRRELNSQDVSGLRFFLFKLSLFLALLLGSSVSLQDLQGLLDLGAESIGTLQKMEELGVVHLEEHAGDLAGKVRLGVMDEGIEPLPDHVLLHLGGGRREGRRLVGGRLHV